MKRAFTWFASLLFLGTYTSSYGQSNTNSQAGGLPALAAEVAQLRALVQSLQEQIGESGDPYAGTYAVTLVEMGLFGCGTGNVPTPGQPLIPYLIPQSFSSVSSRSASFDVESDGSVIIVPEFAELTNELRLSGKYEEEIEFEGDLVVPINADGSITYTAEEGEVLRGQFSADGNVLSVLVQGFEMYPSGCADSYTVSLTGVKK